MTIPALSLATVLLIFLIFWWMLWNDYGLVSSKFFVRVMLESSDLQISLVYSNVIKPIIVFFYKTHPVIPYLFFFFGFRARKILVDFNLSRNACPFKFTVTP